MDLYRWNELLICSAVLALLVQLSLHQFDIPKAICWPIGVNSISTNELLQTQKCIDNIT